MTFAASQGRSHVAPLSLLTCTAKVSLFLNMANFFTRKNKQKGKKTIAGRGKFWGL